MHCFEKQGNTLIYRCINEILRIEPWGSGIRVRATKNSEFLNRNWALLPVAQNPEDVSIECTENEAVISNKKTVVRINSDGHMFFENAKGETLLQERWRIPLRTDDSFSILNIPARQYKHLPGGKFHFTYRLEPNEGEKIFGMGQYQDGHLDMKGCVLDLEQRNSQVSVPFYISSLRYGFLWNNPAIGKVSFGKNLTEWIAEVTEGLDIWFVVDDTPAQIMADYTEVTGRVPMMPENAMGFWQCKLRYRTQDELLNVAKEYNRRGIPISKIVIDFFHWTKQGEWKFDPRYWPDPTAMVKELKDMGMDLVVSIWPTVEFESENYNYMRKNGFLIETKTGVPVSMLSLGKSCAFYDTTNADARAFVWNKVKENYLVHGIMSFWLDVAEPEYTGYHYDNYLHKLGSCLEVGNIYPMTYAQGFYEGLRSAGVENPISLIRSAWAGSQRYGALVWSGDIPTQFKTMRVQLAAGLSMAMAGIAWWTTDIGGFHGGDQNDPVYRELIIRWFQWGTFCPVMRLHGNRKNGPKDIPPGECPSGGPNEIWSYGEEAYRIMSFYIGIREKIRPYIREIMREAHEKGAPPMRPVFFDFPNDPLSWEQTDEYMFGKDWLVAPIMEYGCRNRTVYLPSGANWTDAHTGKYYAGGQHIDVDAPLEVIPLFIRDGSNLSIKI